MKAVIFDKKHQPEKLVYGDVEKPVPDNNEVLIKVHATSVNAADYRSMKMGLIPKRKIFGADVAGVVESVGERVTLFKTGDAVIGDLVSSGFGAFAEYVAAPEKMLVKKPATISFEDAAALPLAGVTALQALRKGNIQKNQKVLIVGSAGGVGTFAVQLARNFGAEVTAVCSTRNVEQTVMLGAHHVIDYSKDDFTKSNNRYDLILAVNGNKPLTAYKRLLKSNGTFVMIGGALPQIIKTLLFGKLMSLGSKKMNSLTAKSNQKDLEYLLKQVEAGKIKPVIEKRYSLDKAAEAMNYLSQGHAKAKVVINVK